jgi:hypothetical protein
MEGFKVPARAPELNAKVVDVDAGPKPKMVRKSSRLCTVVDASK